MVDTGKQGRDAEEIYCRMLGHHLQFSYCRTCRDGLPCFKLLDCWFERFDVEAFVREHYTEEEIRQFLEPPKPKMHTLMELIKKAQTRSR